MSADDTPRLDLSYDFKLLKVQVVAIFEHEGGALVHDGLALTLSEGRSWSAGDDLSRHYYSFEFAETEAPEPEACEAAEAKVVITGTDENGRRMEIRGKGWLGFSDHGRLEGRFDQPPIMLTGDGPEDGEERGWPSGPRAKPSKEYLRALRGRTLSDSEGDTE